MNTKGLALGVNTGAVPLTKELKDIVFVATDCSRVLPFNTETSIW
jgi:hypothetical protein